MRNGESEHGKPKILQHTFDLIIAVVFDMNIGESREVDGEIDLVIGHLKEIGGHGSRIRKIGTDIENDLGNLGDEMLEVEEETLLVLIVYGFGVIGFGSLRDDDAV